MDIHQDARLFSGILDAGTRIDHALAPGRHAWIQVARGSIVVNDVQAQQGDGVIAVAESHLAIVAGEDSEFLLFDLA